MTTVFIQDCRELKYCTSGVRRYFRAHQLDFEDFIRRGIDAAKFKQDDPMVVPLIEVAKRRETENNGQQ